MFIKQRKLTMLILFKGTVRNIYERGLMGGVLNKFKKREKLTKS